MRKPRRRDAVARRITLALSICFATTCSSAAEVDATTKGSSLRHLLSQGWKSQSATTPRESSQSDDRLEAAKRPAGKTPQSTPIETADLASKGKSTLAPSEPREEQVEAGNPPTSGGSLADLLRMEKLKTREREAGSLLPENADEDASDAQGLSALTADPEAIDAEPMLQLSTADPFETNVVMGSLADYLRANREVPNPSKHPSPASAVESSFEKANSTRFVAPTRKPLPSQRQREEPNVSQQEVVRSAPSLSTGQNIHTANTRAETFQPAMGSASSRPSRKADALAQTAVPVPSLATVPPRIIRVHNDSLLAKDNMRKPGAQPDKAFGVSRPAAQAPSSLTQVPETPSPALDSTSSETSSSVPSQTQVTGAGERRSDGAVADRSPAHVQLPLSDPIRNPKVDLFSERVAGSQAAEQEVYAVLPVPSLESVDTLIPPSPLSPTTPSVTLHTSRLLELAQHAIWKSEQSLQRGATHTARKFAIEAVRMVVSMRDAQERGNLHGQQLNHAFDAIRESNDFCGKFGSVDHSTLQRMVDVHETNVLKTEDLSNLSPLEATEAYLEYAKEQFVLATGGIREGSQALILLGQIEFQIADHTDTHATSVAVTIQRAAVEADPYYSVGYRILGTTLLKLGLVEEAASCLITSLQIQPTRLAYESLLDVSRRLGDVDTARVCVKALEDPRMEDGGIVQSLSPQAFASTYRPDPKPVDRERTASQDTDVKAQSGPVFRVGFGSLFPFGRK